MPTNTIIVKMASSGLSSNWKKLKARLQQQGLDSDPPSSSQAGRPTKKRKAGDDDTSSSTAKPPRPNKKAKTSQASPSSSARPLVAAKKKTKTKPNQKNMGAVQSQPSKHDNPTTVTTTTTTSEEIAEAYDLGTKDATAFLRHDPPRPNQGLSPSANKIGKYIAIDCEMVGVGEGGHAHALARVSIVDFHGRQVYDSYVRPRERVVDWRTHVSGIAPKHMAAARDWGEVRAAVADLFDGRVLVGHDIKHDLEVLMLQHPHKMVRDTAKFAPFKKYGHGPKPALKVLAREILGVEIQTGQHSSLEDAKAAMLLFRKYKPAFDVDIANRYPDPTPRSPQSKVKPKQKKTKKKRRN